MPAKHRIYLVSSFGPEIMQALLRGAKERFEVPLTYRMAVQFSQRINRLRRAMREEAHPQYGLVAKTKITIVWGKRAGYPEVEEKASSQNVKTPRDIDSPAKLIIQPHDKEFSAALIAAGIRVDDLRIDPLDEIARPTTTPDFLDQFATPSSKKLP